MVRDFKQFCVFMFAAFPFLRPRPMEKKPSLPAERSASSTKIRQRRPFRTRFECAFLFDNFAILPLPLILYCLQYPFSSITTRERQVGKRGSRFQGPWQRYGVKRSFSVQDATCSPENHLYAKRVFHSSAGRIAMKTLVIFTNLGRGGPS